MNIKKIFSGVLLLTVAAWATGAKLHRQAKVSFTDFKELVAGVEPHRAARQVDLDAFLKMSTDPNTIIFDSRSDFRFERIHLKGAKHLAFTDFTQDNLRKVIPSPSTRILIYCNNNFDGNQIDFATKVAMPNTLNSSNPNKNSDAAGQFAAQEKPRMMALNIPTYINLYGYGYRNVFELDELVDVKDPRIQFQGSLIRPH